MSKNISNNPVNNQREFILSMQILKSRNLIRKTESAQNKSNFIHKRRIFFIFIFIFSFFVFNANAQTLNDYIQIAVKNNSDLKVKTANYTLEKEKVNEISYENTNFSTGFFALTPETRVGSQLFKVGVSQKLPWFGELDADKKSLQTKANLNRYDIAITERDIIYKVKQAYYQIYVQEAITNILKDNKLILKTYENMALAALENNRATMSDVLRIRVQKNELHSKMFQNINSIEYLSENFNRLLQRDIKTPLNVVDSLNILDILQKNNRIEKHPILEKITETDKVYQAERTIISIDKKPKITVGLDYILVDKQKDFNPSQNGKDIIMPKIAISIPIFNKKHKSQFQQIKIKQEILKEELIAQKTNLEIALQQAKLELDNAILTVVAAQKNKEEIQRAINVDLKAYETGILDYDKILRLQLQKIKFQLMEINAIKKAYIAKSKIEYLAD